MNLFSHEELQNSGKSFYGKQTRDYRKSCPSYQFFQPLVTNTIFFCYLYIGKHCMTERICCKCKTHRPHRIHGPHGKNAPFQFAGASKAFKPCSLKQLLCDGHHRGCDEQVTAWVYSPKYKQTSHVIQCVAKTAAELHSTELLREKVDLS